MRRQLFYQLHTRLTAVVLAAVIIPITALLILVSFQARQGMEGGAIERLESVGQFVSDKTTAFLEMNDRALLELASYDEIANMDPETQKPLLQAMVNAYPHIQLVSTVDMNGDNLARSDNSLMNNYSNWAWFQSAATGYPLTYQSVAKWGSRGRPALIASMPIRDPDGIILGVIMYASNLDPLRDMVNGSQFQQTGIAYVVDETGLALAHPEYTGEEMPNMQAEEPVTELLNGVNGHSSFTDLGGTEWIAFSQELDNGWAVVVQQETAEVNMALLMLQRFIIVGTVLTIIVVSMLVFLFTRVTLRPVQDLTKAAFAITEGDYSQTIPVRRRDELGILANAFNTMISQIQGLIFNLEQRVTKRTEELFQQAQELEVSNRLNQRRATQLEASAKVASAVNSILEPERLLNQVVELISENFGYYHVGIFLLDETRTWAVLSSANSQGGQSMLARGHRLRVAEQSIVGYATFRGQPRLAVDVGADAIYFDNPDLPETRSEIALPLIAHDQTLGALDIQSTRAETFDELEVTILRALADQIALALDNARLFAATQEALRQVETIQQQAISRTWSQHIEGRGRSGLYFYRQEEAESATIPPMSDALQAQETTLITAGENGQDTAVVAPIKVRDQVIGALGLQDVQDYQWSREQIELIETVADQVGQALEAARLFEETQRRAHRESLIGEISDRIRGADDIDEILRITIQEARRALGATHGAIRLGTETHLRPTNHQEGENV